MFDVDYTALEKGLELMGIGMLGIFAVLFILYVTSILLIKLFPSKGDNSSVKN
ncbi:OadG-related small transporter subunit [Desemzia sp. FAM 24101]|uniref:OadG-related small transporter subunit n=1 Tax=unclassified Desemzia TaxID=2685243 RepID=UPI0038856F6C